MATPENNLKNEYERTLTPDQRLWRVNSGMAWAGRVIKKIGGVLTLAEYRPFFGAPKGFPDAVGFDSITITPDMVGKRVAVFVGAEYKTGRQSLGKQQRDFKNLIVSMGGIHREVRDSEIIESGFH